MITNCTKIILTNFLVLTMSFVLKAQVVKNTLKPNMPHIEVKSASAPFENPSDWCPTEKWHQQMLLKDPQYKRDNDLFEKAYQYNFIRGINNPFQLQTRAVSTVPVVIHVFHSGEQVGTQANPSDEMLKLWVERASNAFRHTSGATFSGHPLSGVDCEINLCLARKDPSNNPSSGIKRYNIPTLANLPADFDPVAFNPYLWNKSKYCNLIIITSTADNYAGVFYGGTFYDFTIYVSSSMGTPTNPNAGLAAHELGHYFSLKHTFEGGCTNNNCLTDGDQVCDTPPKDEPGLAGGTCAIPSNTCPTDDDDVSTNNPYRPATNGGAGDQTDHLENYMDYTSFCWSAFSQGQKIRMQTNISTRSMLTGNASACNIIATACTAPTDLTTHTLNSNAVLYWAEDANATSWQIKYGPSGFNPNTAGTAVTVTTKPYTLTNLLLNTTYDWYVRAVCGTGFSAFSAVQSFTTPMAVNYCNVVYTNPCATIAHSSGNIPISIQGVEIKNTNTNAIILNNQNNGCLGSSSDHTAIMGNVSANTNYTYTVDFALSTGGYCFLGYLGIWIDYNCDADFDDPNETIFLSPNADGCTFTGTFIIPANTTNGKKRMRIRRVNGTFAANPYCANYTEGETEEYTLNVTGGVVTPLILSAKVILQGSYSTITDGNAIKGLMNDDLRNNTSIPIIEPYTTLGFTHIGGGGESITNTSILTVTGNNAIVDWIFVELRRKINVTDANTTLIATRSALIQRDGDIVATDGFSPISFNASIDFSYFIVVRHRNHLAIQSATTKALCGTVTEVIDMTSLNNINPTTPSVSITVDGITRYALYSGDLNGDNIINAADRSTAWNDRNLTGYRRSDCNMNGTVDNIDRSNTWNNRNLISKM
jgi:hypothetical protein